MDEEGVRRVQNGMSLGRGKMDEIVRFVTTWLDPEDMMLSKKVRGKKTDAVGFHSRVGQKRTERRTSKADGKTRHKLRRRGRTGGSGGAGGGAEPTAAEGVWPCADDGGRGRRCGRRFRG